VARRSHPAAAAEGSRQPAGSRVQRGSKRQHCRWLMHAASKQWPAGIAVLQRPQPAMGYTYSSLSCYNLALAHAVQ
jgi:hypothetical protein